MTCAPSGVPVSGVYVYTRHQREPNYQTSYQSKPNITLENEPNASIPTHVLPRPTVEVGEDRDGADIGHDLLRSVPPRTVEGEAQCKTSGEPLDQLP